MSLKTLLDELEREACVLTTKSLPAVGMDYRGRTKLERLLFLILQEYASKQFTYRLGGVAYTHQRSFREEAERGSWPPNQIDAMNQGFRLCDLIRDVGSSDQYIAERALVELGGTGDRLLTGIERRIRVFIKQVRTADEP